MAKPKRLVQPVEDPVRGAFRLETTGKRLAVNAIELADACKAETAQEERCLTGKTQGRDRDIHETVSFFSIGQNGAWRCA